MSWVEPPLGLLPLEPPSLRSRGGERVAQVPVGRWYGTPRVPETCALTTAPQVVMVTLCRVSRSQNPPPHRVQ